MLVTEHGDHCCEPVWSQELTTGTGGKGLRPPTTVSTAVLRKPRTRFRPRSQAASGCRAPSWHGAAHPPTPPPAQQTLHRKLAEPIPPLRATLHLCSHPSFCALRL